MRRRWIVVAAGGLVAAAVVVALIAATGGDGGCGDGYPETPLCVAEAYVTRDDASKCDLVEPRVLEGLVHARGDAARERCARTVAARRPPEEYTVIDHETERDEAEVEFLADGKEGSVQMRRSDGRWRIVSFAE